MSEGIDFGRYTNDYARHRPGLPASFFDRIDRDFVSIEGKTIVDLGTGPGFAAIECARRGAIRAIGFDISENQIDSAKYLAEESGVSDHTQFLVRGAEDTGLEAESADLVLAVQCWGWFDDDAALAEAHRILRDRAHLIVAQYCYLPRRSDIARASEEMVLAHNPQWTMADFDGLYPWRVDQLARGGFSFVVQFCYDEDQVFTHESWRGRMRTCNGVGSGSMSPTQVDDFDHDLKELLAERFPDEPLMIPHRIFAVVVQKTGSLAANAPDHGVPPERGR